MRKLKTVCMVGFFALFASLGLGQDEIDFDKHVGPILKKHCAACHNADDYEAGFSVDSFEELEEGSDGEAVYEAGDPENSWMIQLMTGEKEPMMPPDDQPRPSEKELKTLKRWIEEGAKNSMGTELPKKGPVEVEIATVDKSLAITAADWSAHNILAVGRYESVELLDGDSMKSLAVLPHVGKVNSLSFSKEGNQLLVAGGQVGKEGLARLWDVQSRTRLLEFKGHRDAIYAARISPDGKQIATSSYDKSILIWDAITGELAGKRNGHNGAVFDLEFASNGLVLISASADQTVKAWSTKSDERLDTLGQPLKGQNVTAFSPDGGLIVSGGMDKRIWIWKFESRQTAQVNSLVDSKFAHEGAIVDLEFSQDGEFLVSASEDRSIKVWDGETFKLLGVVDKQTDFCGSLAIAPDSRKCFVGRLDGTSETLMLDQFLSDVVEVESKSATSDEPTVELASAFSELVEAEPNDTFERANALSIPAYASGVIHRTGSGGDKDLFRFTVKKGQRLALETKASRNKSPVDTRLEILDSAGKPVPQVALRAVRESYFTFRGKDSNTSDDFRIHNWEEMELNQFLYCNGEVVKLYHHPRGPDSGFQVYPGAGKRHGFFGTTATSHALHESCYIVEPFPVGTKFQANGLPVFQNNYENDDGANRAIGSDSRIDFVAPDDGEYIVKVTDARGFSGENFKYRLEVRPLQPDFRASISNPDKISPRGGVEFSVSVNRIDGFDSPVQFELKGLPKGFQVTSPLMIEAGHSRARGTIWFDGDEISDSKVDWEKVRVVAKSTLNGSEITKDVSGFKPIALGEAAKAEIRIAELEWTMEDAFESSGTLELIVRAGQSVEARVYLKRNGHKGRVNFGMADAGRNLPHGVYVDDIGLNGLMVPAGVNEQRFFIKADDWVQPQERLFFLRANNVAGQVSLPVLLKIVE
jgi:hypothetical protein